MSTVKATRTDQRGQARNGLGGFHDYAYRGVLTLEADLEYECLGGCGRRADTEQVCAVCRGYFDRADGKAKA